jgi:hypothetical protein
LLAIDVSQPESPEVWSTYYGPASWGFSGVENVKGYLYISAYKDWEGFWEIIAPCVDEINHKVYFNSVFPPLDPSLELVPITNGNPKGHYAIGNINDTTYVVLNTVDPVSPSVIKSFITPYEDWPPFRAYDFDDQYLYLFSYLTNDKLGRGLYAVDIFSPDSLPVYAVGDTFGQSNAGEIVSWGKNVYLCDRLLTGGAGGDQSTRLRVFEKARGCKVNMDVNSVILDPKSDVYQIDHNIAINWSISGCPIKVSVRLFEDYITKQFLKSVNKFDNPFLASGSFNWTVAGISADPQNHYYYIEVFARNIEGICDYGYSRVFHIVEERGDAKPGDNPYIGCGLENGGEEKHPMHELNERLSNTGPYYIKLPKAIKFDRNRLEIGVYGCSGSITVLDDIELIVVDSKEGYSSRPSGKESDRWYISCRAAQN